MTSVTPFDLGRKIIEILGVRSGEVVELSKLKNGAVLLSKPDEAGAQK